MELVSATVLSTVLMFVREIFFITFYFIAAQYSMEMIYWSVDLTNIIMMGIMLTVAIVVLRNVLRSDSTEN